MTKSSMTLGAVEGSRNIRYPVIVNLGSIASIRRSSARASLRRPRWALATILARACRSMSSTVMTELHKQGRYDRMSDDYLKLTGETPTSMFAFVKLHAAEFTRTEAAA